jgi:hypothetical protein
MKCVSVTQPTPKLSTSSFKLYALPFKACVAWTGTFEAKKEDHNMFIIVTTKNNKRLFHGKAEISKISK